MQRIKMLHLISRIDIGGAEKQLLALLSHLDKDKYDISVWYFEGEGELKREFRDAGVETKKFKFSCPCDLSIGVRLYRDMRTAKYDIVHTHGFKADIWGGLIAKLLGVPVVISTLHNQEWYLRNPLARLLERFFALHIFDRIIAVSEGIKRFAEQAGKLPKEKISRIYYGIDAPALKPDKGRDIREEFGIDKGAPLIGCVGRLTEQKGHRYLIQAAKKVVEKFPEAKFLIVGKGGLEKKLRRLAGNLGLNSHIIFTGFRKDVYSIIDSLNLMVMPSVWEGLGLVLLEAMAMGKPVVAANTGGIPEIVQDGKTGILVKPGDADSLARAISRLLEEVALARKMSDTARLSVQEKFSIGRMVGAIDKIYNGLIEHKLKKKIKVLQIIESTGKSGPRYLLGSLAHNLNKDDFQLEVVCSTLRDKDFEQDIQKMQKKGIRVKVIQMKREISPLGDLFAFFKLCFHIKRGNYDIVHTHSSKAGFLGRLAARLIGVRAVIHTPHCFCFMAEDMNGIKKQFYFHVEKFAAFFCDRLIAVSDFQRQDMLKMRLTDPRKVLTIENGVDSGTFSNNGFDILKKKNELGLNNGSIILGAVGVLNESKGHRYLIEAVSKIVQTGLDVRLLIAGEGPLRKQLEALSRDLGLDSRVRLLGFREDIPELLALMDIFVFPSLWEGMSLALLEAMAVGLPIISTDVHGAVDLIRDNKSGILVQKKDTRGLVKAIRHLVSNPNETKKMGQEARRLVHSNYTLERQIGKLESLYKSIIHI
jgi:glycosyltransferase involved in cell wall biosynthesis